MFNLNDKVTSYSSQCIGIIIESVTYTGRIVKANKKSFKAEFPLSIQYSSLSASELLFLPCCLSRAQKEKLLPAGQQSVNVLKLNKKSADPLERVSAGASATKYKRVRRLLPAGTGTAPQSTGSWHGTDCLYCSTSP